jgi:hypothetical protein
VYGLDQDEDLVVVAMLPQHVERKDMLQAMWYSSLVTLSKSPLLDLSIAPMPLGVDCTIVDG